MQYFRIGAVLTFIGGLTAYDLTPTQAELYCVYNGWFSDRQQAETDATNRTEIDFRVYNVMIPGVSQLPVVYVEESNDNVVVLAEIGIVSEGADGNIYLDPYNFTGNTEIKPGTVDLTHLKSLSLDKLQGQKDCRDVIRRIAPFTFVVSWSDCRHPAINGLRLQYAAIFTCNNLTAIMPEGAAEKPTLLPYEYYRQGHKFPLDDAPANYVCNCDNTAG